MANDNSFIIKLQAMLDKTKSIANIKSDIKAIEPKLPKVKLQGTLLKTATRKELNEKLKTINPKVKIDADTSLVEKKIKKIGKQKTDTTITPKVDNTQVVSGLKQAQKETKTLWERFTANIFGANLICMGTQKVIQAVNEAFRSIKELDTIKTNIQMVSNTSDLSVNAMMSSYNAMAKELSSTTKDVAEAANEFLRMGESVENTNELIRSSQILSKVGMIDSADAASYLISSLKGYQVAAENSIDVVSKLTSVDLEAAVSAGGLAEAISHCSNIANNSGTSMDRLIGYTAAVGEVTQESMLVIGNAFKSIYSRMNNIKIGKFIDDETGESLSDTEAVLNKLGIQLRDTANTYRNFDDVLDDIGERWNSLTQVEQNALSVAIAGTMQRERFTVLMNNYSKALEYSEVAANSAGSALERYGVYQDSIEAKTNELTAAIESLSTNIISEGLYSGILQATAGLVKFLDKTNLLKGTLAGLVAMGVSKTIASIGAGFITAAKSTAQLSAAMKLFDNGRSMDNLRDIGAACKGLSEKQLKLVLSTKGLINEDRKLILEGMGVKEQECQQTLTTLGFSAAEDKATASTFSLRGAMNALKTAIALNPLMAIATAVSAAVMAFSAYSNAMEETRQKAKDFGSEIQSTKSEIEDYKNRIAELQNTISDSSASFDDVSQARKDLMAVQDELIKKFGTEKETIEIITGAINNQADALDTLTKKQYQQWKNEFNNKSFSQSAGDFFASDNIANAFYKLTEFDFSGAWDMLTAPTESNIDKMVDSMRYAYYKIGKSGNDTLDSLIAKTYDLYDTGSDFVLSGNLNDIYEDLLGIQEMSKDFNVSDRFEMGITKVANVMSNTLDSYKEAYRTFILYEKILDDAKDNQYDEQFDLINKAKEAYDDALISGDRDKIKKASDEYAQTLQSAIDLAMQNSDFDVADYFKSMYPELRQMFGEWQFNIDFEPNKDGLKDKVANAIDSIDGVSDGTASFSVEDIENFNPNIVTQEQIDAYGELTNVAESYGLTIKQLITLLQTMGLLQSESYQQLVDTFGQENVDKLSPEDLEIAYQIKNIGNMTFEELQTEIEKAKEVANEPISLSISQTVDQLDTRLKPAMDSLKSAWQDIFTGDEADLNSINILSTYDSIKSKLDELNNINGITVDYSSYEDFVRVLRNSESTTNEVKEAFNSLATSITQAALSGAEDFETMKAALEDLGVVNSEMVAFDALISNTEALKEADLDLASATYNDIKKFADERVAAENLAQAINMLTRQKMLSALEGMDTSKEISNIIALAKQAGLTSEVIANLTELEKIYQIIASGTITSSHYIDRAEELKQLIMDEIKVDYTPEVDFSHIEKATKKTEINFTDLLDKELTVLDKKMEAGYIDFKDYIQARLALIEDYYSQGKIKVDEYYSYLENHYKQELSYRDKVIKAVTRRIDKEIKSLEKEKDAIKENYQIQIDALENQKTLLEDVNKERQRQIDLQKALYELERAKNQRTKLVYSEGGMHYVADDTAIRDAENEAENARQEIQISEIEKSISELEKARDAETDAIDNMIDKLQEYKEAWNDITSAYEESQEDLLAEQMLGRDWEKDILDARLDKLNQFKDDYIKIQQTMVDAAHKAAQAMETSDNVTIDDSSKDKYEVVYEGTAETVDKFSSLSKAQQIAKEMSEGIPDDEPSYYVRQKYHTGLQQGTVNTHSFDDDFKLVQKVGLGEKEVPAILKKGEAVATPAQISNIADGLRTTDSIHSVQAERPYCVIEQEKLGRCAEVLGRSIDEMLFPMGIQPNNIREMSNMGRLLESINNVNNVTNNNKNIQQHVTVQIGDINLTGVQDVNGLSQAIKTRLPGKMMQEYFKN